MTFPTQDGPVTAVQGLSYTVELGKTLGIVGESGSGKSVSSMAVMGLHDAKSSKITGSIRVDGTEVVGLSESRMRTLRGNSMSMIFQDALAALHPFYKIGGQLEEAYLVHHPSASKRDARRKAIEMLDRVGIPQPDRRVDDFPHQFSGGMRQRAMIAMGLINDPSLLIADEPTTALDVTVQAQILDLLQDLQREFNSAVIIITHDLGVIAEMADDVLVMYAGRCVEFGTTKEILTQPEMPYTWGLLSSIPDVTASTDAPADPDPGQPAQPAEPAVRMLVPPALRAPGQGARRPVRHRAARAGRRQARAPDTSSAATSPTPAGDLPDARSCRRSPPNSSRRPDDPGPEHPGPDRAHRGRCQRRGDR